MKSKRILSILLALVFVLTLLPAASLPAKAAAYPTPEHKAQCGDNAYWWLSGGDGTERTGIIYVEGYGPMWDFDVAQTTDAPWYGVKCDNIFIMEGITRVGNYAFCGALPNTVMLPTTLEVIGSYGFSNMSKSEGGKTLQMQSFPDLPIRLRRLEDRAFAGAHVYGNIELPASLEYVGDAALSGAVAPIERSFGIYFNGPVKYLGRFALGFNYILSEIRFVGHAPDYIAPDVFSNIRPNEGNYAGTNYCNIYYPANDPTWTGIADQNYGGGRISWHATNMSNNTCGNDLTWYYDEVRWIPVLRISGTGPMWDFTSQDPGYKAESTFYADLMLDEGITTIGSCAFKGITIMDEYLEIPSTVTSIRSEAFSGSGLDTVVFKGRAPAIAADAFIGCSFKAIYEDISFSPAVLQDYGGSITWIGSPIITGQDSMVYAEAGQKASLSVKAKGDPLNYQWQYRISAAMPWTDASDTNFNQATYTPKVTLLMDGYEFRCKIWNEAKTIYSAPITLTVAEPTVVPPAVASLTANKTAAASGDTVTWTAAATGGSGELQYNFYIYQDGSVVRKTGYTAAKTISCIVSDPGTYFAKVFVKDEANTVVTKTGGTVTVTAPAAPLTVTGLTANKTSAAPGEAVTWTAAASGGTGTLRYNFYIYQDGTLIHKGGYSTSKSITYTPTVAGNYSIKVYVKDGASAVVTKTGGAVAVTAPAAPLTVTGLTANKTSAAPGEAVTWTAAASGGTGTLRYNFYIYQDGTLIHKGGYSTSKSITYTPTVAGNYAVKVYVKDGASAVVTKTGGAVTVSAPAAPLSVASVSANKSSSAAGEAVTWTAAASGGTGTLRYNFYIYQDGTLIHKGGYSTSKSITYTPTVAGTYSVKVYVKDGASAVVTKTGGTVTVTG